VLLNAARDGRRRKRGGGWHATTLHSGLADAAADPVDLLALDAAMQALAAADPRLARVVELHFFAGLDFAAVGELTGTSERTAKRDWRAARALLQMHLDDAAGAPHD
jgi:DNA-directed RNA polymerase specialized sigma24 family protein